jgi:hypothetical protein
MTAGQIIAAVMNKSLRYDTRTAFDPVSLIATAGLIIVARPDFPTNNVKELIAMARAKPGKIAFASPGFGATQHFTGELFKQIADVDMLHVPFRTSPEAISAVLGGQVNILFDTISAVLGQVQLIRRPQGARRHRQGPLSGGTGRAGGRRIRHAAGLRRHHLVRHFCPARHAGCNHREAQQDAQRGNRAGRRGGTVDQGRRGRARLHRRGVRQAYGGRARALEVRERAGIARQ